jgi:hypothetical protein
MKALHRPVLFSSTALRSFPAIASAFAAILGFLSSGRAEAAPDQTVMAKAVFQHAMQCEWELEGRKQKGVTAEVNIDVESVKWNEAESAIEFKLCFTQPKGDVAEQIATGGTKTKKEWTFTGKWKAEKKGVLSSTWTISDAPGSYKPTASAFPRPALTRTKIPVQ